ncbi:MAG TPA: hypothetical protein VHA56_15370 [Mucilaginibacter sp.]|nr:hypothetical protein [Mucilaginibacter sp.]
MAVRVSVTMDDFEFLIFIELFRDTLIKCFGSSMERPLTETESRMLCKDILDQTGLSVGWKSVKNYSIFIAAPESGKKENPSVATLDTFSRYVLNAPYTNELQRKKEEDHHPYWFLYRDHYNKNVSKKVVRRRPQRLIISLAGLILLAIIVMLFFKFSAKTLDISFSDNFSNLNNADMRSRGWFVKSEDTIWWKKRNEIPGRLTLFTLRGDNWPDQRFIAGIPNLVLRSIPSDCFTAEVHLEDFIPGAEWQQAGVLLMEDTSFRGKSIRLSLGYNDYFGGMKKPSEILVQCITSIGEGFGKPEEIAHKVLFYPDSARNSSLITDNLKNSALRIEKQGNKFRFLYAGGTTENGAFKEVVSQEFDMKPKYIGLFAIKGFTDSKIVPVRFKFFRLTGSDCSN